MNHHRFPASIAVLALAGALALSSCKQSSTPQSGNQQTNNQQPGSAPAGNQPAGSMPGVQTQQPPTSEQAASQGTNEAPGAYGAQQSPGAAASATAPAAVEIPAGTRLHVRLNQALGSKISYTGETFGATVAEDVVVNGTTVIPRGARAEGKVIDAKGRGKIKGRALLAIRLEGVKTDWGNYPVSTSTVERAMAGKGRRSAKFIGGGGALGGLIGGLAGGGKGLVIGAAAGAGAGAAGGAFTGNKQIVLPAGTVLTFRLERAVRVSS
jgi:hypothetical protein